jgi:hypothetical protein
MLYLCSTEIKQQTNTLNFTTMTTVENIIRTTNPTTIVKGENMVKGMYGKRQVVVNYDKSQDLFNIWAFTLKGVNLIKEYKVNGVFIEQLKETIEGMK